MEPKLKYEPVKVEMPQDMSALYQELGFEYSTIEKAESKIVAEMDSIYATENSYYIHRMHNEKLITLIKHDPRAYSYDFPLMQKRDYVSVVASDDNKLRLFYWDTGEGGTMIDWGNLCLFESEGKIFMYDCGIYEIENTEADEFSPGCAVERLHTIKADNGEQYYLAQIYIRESSNLGYQEIFPVKISDGKLVPVEIFDRDSDNYNNCTREYTIADWYYKANVGEGWDWLYRFDKDNQTLYVPEVVDMELTDRYNLYRFNGKRFEYIGDDGGFWLHPSIREFKRLKLLFCTKDYRIRIDVMDNDTYRYTSWKKSASMSERPDLIIHNGIYNESDKKFHFENNGYTYCIEPDISASQLTIYHDGDLLICQKTVSRYNSK